MREQNCIFKDTTMGPIITKEMKYNLHYGEVRGIVLRPPDGTSTSCTILFNTNLFLLIKPPTKKMWSLILRKHIRGLEVET